MWEAELVNYTNVIFGLAASQPLPTPRCIIQRVHSSIEGREPVFPRLWKVHPVQGCIVDAHLVAVEVGHPWSQSLLCAQATAAPQTLMLSQCPWELGFSGVHAWSWDCTADVEPDTPNLSRICLGCWCTMDVEPMVMDVPGPHILRPGYSL